MEKWKNIPELNGKYQCSNYGRVRRVNKDPRCQKYKYLKLQTNNQGYIYAHCTREYRKLVHRIVGKLFIKNMKNYPHINHKDSNPKNNNAKNLEWCTAKQNSQHANDKGRLGRLSWEVLDNETGIFYNSILELSEAVGIPYKRLIQGIHNNVEKYKRFTKIEKTYKNIFGLGKEPRTITP